MLTSLLWAMSEVVPDSNKGTEFVNKIDGSRHKSVPDLTIKPAAPDTIS